MYATSPQDSCENKDKCRRSLMGIVHNMCKSTVVVWVYSGHMESSGPSLVLKNISFHPSIYIGPLPSWPFTLSGM